MNADKAINIKNTTGEILAGYLFRFENFGIGTEVSWQYSSAENTIEKSYLPGPAVDTDNAVSVQYRLTTSTGINAKLGYFLNENFIYGILGWQQQRIRCKYSFVITDLAVLGEPAYRFYQTKNFNINAVSLGIGAQRPINESY